MKYKIYKNLNKEITKFGLVFNYFIVFLLTLFLSCLLFLATYNTSLILALAILLLPAIVYVFLYTIQKKYTSKDINMRLSFNAKPKFIKINKFT